jgi:hypothetical protein
MKRPNPEAKKPSNTYNENISGISENFSGVSLFILALGFSSIGLMSLIHQPLSDDSLAISELSCVIGGWASIAVASVFIFAALLYLRRHSWLTA